MLKEYYVRLLGSTRKQIILVLSTCPSNGLIVSRGGDLFVFFNGEFFDFDVKVLVGPDGNSLEDLAAVTCPPNDGQIMILTKAGTLTEVVVPSAELPLPGIWWCGELVTPMSFDQYQVIRNGDRFYATSK